MNPQKAPSEQASSEKASSEKAPPKKGSSGGAAPRKRPRSAAAAASHGKAAGGTRRPSGEAALAESLRVREDESPWTAEELREVRVAIEANVQHLTEEIQMAQADLVGLMRDGGDGAGDDQADAGAMTFEREQEISLANNARDMLLQNLHALERLDDGSYGICESCGQPIGKLRLQAAPRATLCVPCKTRQERR